MIMKFLKSVSGSSAIEYAIIAGMISIVIVVGELIDRSKSPQYDQLLTFLLSTNEIPTFSTSICQFIHCYILALKVINTYSI